MKVLFTGSFDPITLGHIDIIHRLCRMYDHVTVGIAINPDKKYMFTVEQRMAFIANAILDEYKPKVAIMRIDGFVAEYAYSNGIDVIARGVRDANDLSSEIPMAEFNVDIGSIETVMLPTKPTFAKISSSAVKSIAKNFGYIGDYVTPMVKHALEVKNGINLIGVVGQSGSGKTTVCNALVDILNTRTSTMPNRLFSDTSVGVLNGLPLNRAAFIDMDKVGHMVHTSDEPFAINARELLAHAFGSDILDANRHINRSALRNIVFSDRSALNKLDEVMKRPMYHLFMRKIRELRAESNVTMRTIFIDAAVMVEHNSLSVVNNQILHLVTDNDICIERIMHRDGITREQAVARLGSQLSPHEKSAKIERIFERSQYGDMMELYGEIDDAIIEWIVGNGWEYV